MEIKKKYFYKYLHEIAIEQIKDEYVDKGYKVLTEFKLGRNSADLVAKKGEETIVFEIKSGKTSPIEKERISQIADYVKNKTNYKFLLVVATPPKEKNLEIDDLEQLLFEHFFEEFPPELMDLSSHTTLDEVADVDIDEIRISGNWIFVNGTGVVGLELEYGNAGDHGEGEGYLTNDSFPFDFELTLGYDESGKLYIHEVDKLEVDTSSFYE